MQRRRFLQLLGGGAMAAAAWRGPIRRALAAAPAGVSDEFFVFVCATGGWDVTLWADPRNEHVGRIDPPSTDNVDAHSMKRWADAPLDGGKKSFRLVEPAGAKMAFGPAIGDLADLYDRLTIVNGLAMNTVGHRDGVCFSSTGRHLAGGEGGAAPVSTIDTVIANELGREQMLPLVSVGFGSTYVGDHLDPRAIPLRVDSIGGLSKSLYRREAAFNAADRADVTTLLEGEAGDLGARSYHPQDFARLGSQYATLDRMLTGDLAAAFTTGALMKAHPDLQLESRTQPYASIDAAFAVEAMKRNIVRCVTFGFTGFDTHNSAYRQHGLMLQDSFDLLARFVRVLDATPHPTRPTDRLSEHVHILVFSDFCRTPWINLGGGRDHYPSNSALVISPRFRGNLVYGATDPAELLPVDAGTFAEGKRPVAPPDLLATFLAAFGVDPRAYLRDGEVVKGLLAA